MELDVVEMFIGRWPTGDVTATITNRLSANFMKCEKNRHVTAGTVTALSQLITALFITVSGKFINLDP